MSTTVETITVTRPMKVIAFTLTTITVFLLVATAGASDWVNSGGWREGLFAQCVQKGTPTPLPFKMLAQPGCEKARGVGYIRGTAALVIIGLITNFFGALLTGLGLRSTDPNKKYKYYRVAIYALLAATIALFLAVIVYPVCFTNDLAKEGNNPPLDGFNVTKIQSNDQDFDNDGIPDDQDEDDDGDGIPDIQDNDDDNDGIPDSEDTDDDNDGIPDELDRDISGDDDDGDGIPDSEDLDDDNDGIPDSIDLDDDGDGILDHLDNDDEDDDDDEEAKDFNMDTDGDGLIDAVDPDIDNDGILNSADEDDDGDGTLDALDHRAGDIREFSWGFGYGCSWMCLIFIFISVVLLICDRESEEIFYKERVVEEEEEEEEA